MDDRWQQLLKAAEDVVAQFQAMSQRQHELLVEGQTLESAAENWDEATLGQFIDLHPLMDAVAALKRPPAVDAVDPPASK
jgi:hypothetical protein